MVDFDNPEYADNEGVKLAVYRAGPHPKDTDKPTIMLMHGWPDMAYSWHAQMEALGNAGYPVLAADGRGYGYSDAPKGVENYTMAKLTSDIVAIQDHYGIEQAVLVGHDWGAIVLWQTPFYIGERALGYAGLNVPLLRHFPVDPITIFQQTLGDNMYIVRFQEEGACEPILERDIARTFRFFQRSPGGISEARKPIPKDLIASIKSLDLISMFENGDEILGGQQLLSEDEISRFEKAFSRNGFTGPLHWYRNMRQNWEAQKQFLVDGELPKVTKPCLMFTAELDLPCPPKLAEGMEQLCEPFELVHFDGCGHWTQQERADEVSEALLRWVGRHFG